MLHSRGGSDYCFRHGRYIDYSDDRIPLGNAETELETGKNPAQSGGKTGVDRSQAEMEADTGK